MCGARDGGVSRRADPTRGVLSRAVRPRNPLGEPVLRASVLVVGG